MRRAHQFIVLATSLMIAGCGGQAPGSPAPVPPATTPAGTPESATAPPPQGTAEAAFPLTITRRGGFAGVDDRAAITADGTAVVTRDGQAPVRTKLPAATVTELRRLLAAPEFSGGAVPSASTTCNDGFEFTFVSPSATTVLLDCGDQQRTAPARMLALAGPLFNG
jgi:hypothetical protein